MRKLMDFVLKKVGEEENIHFVIFGEFTVKEDNSIQTPCFSNVRMKKIENEAEIDWEPSTVNWYGTKVRSIDAMVDMYGAFTRNDSNAEFLYVDEELQNLAKQYMEDVIEYEGIKIPKYYYCFYEGNFELCFATDKFSYYKKDFDWNLEMTNTETGLAVASAEFAEMGLYKSKENVKNGKEVLIFNSLPEENMSCNHGENVSCNESNKFNDNSVYEEELPFK